MPVVRVLLREGQEKWYHEAQASIHAPDRTLRITRNQDSTPGISIRVLPVPGICRRHQRGHRG